MLSRPIWVERWERIGCRIEGASGGIGGISSRAWRRVDAAGGSGVWTWRYHGIELWFDVAGFVGSVCDCESCSVFGSCVLRTSRLVLNVRWIGRASCLVDACVVLTCGNDRMVTPASAAKVSRT